MLEIVVASGKGGVGKSLIAASLAVILARKGYRLYGEYIALRFQSWVVVGLPGTGCASALMLRCGRRPLYIGVMGILRAQRHGAHI
ncbi:P-loop NTPase [Desulfurococcus amylolyticus]|uniref:nucleotide-binding protein n=1 Tax=Desulfurococcus amylolyticus TaxID=94694 RepID=UPI0012FED77C|nr:P-loop NTPase [Desulfurococcus amylolyticus]